jgi:uncharacterized membrane protein
MSAILAETFLLIIRWLHTIAAVAWVGGGIFYWVVVRPALRASDSAGLLARVAGPEFGQLVLLCMWTLVITGVVLAFDRLSEETGTVAYFAMLTIKVALVAWMIFIVRARRHPARLSFPGGTRRGLRAVSYALSHVNTVVALGIIVFVLSDLLRWLVERGLAG